MTTNNDHWDGSDRRKNSRDELVKAVVCAIRDEAMIAGIPADEHREQHAFLHEWIEEIKRKRERREKIRTQVTGWAIVTGLGAIGTGAYNAAIYLRDHLK